jgi:hypothetical protein
MPRQRVKCQTLADDDSAHLDESLRVSHFASIETKRLLIEVTKQVERFDRYIRAFDGALQERPEVFEAVGVNLSVHIPFSVVNHLMHVISAQAVIGLQRISKDGRVFLHVGRDGRLQQSLPDTLDDVGADSRVSLWSVTFQEAHHGNLPHSARSGNDALALPLCMKRALPPM